ncbi:tetratricopeptide repeat protein [Sporosarcina sp. Te-1]|uniref:tetratricopeptide repeat protein n=1 Tax=Sporosarcina sp. Te-1 TaxID=2818390 RepID=UPI001A9E9F0E|nr:tetratricopeptide repeat protein [Sporosarcina sp. Te-1]QTD39663.1 tetratricopeptide repeat protein [Sporosarcina sp. Te-1]
MERGGELDVKQALGEAFRLFDAGELEESESLYRQCLDQARNKGDEQSALHGLGFVLAMKGKWSEALACYEELYSRATQDCNNIDQAIALHQIGMVHRMRGAYDLATEAFTQELAQRKVKLPEDHVGFSAVAYELGLLALTEKRIQEAFRYFEESLREGELAGCGICIGCAHRGLGQTYNETGELEQSRSHFMRSADAFEKGGDAPGAAEARSMAE